MKTTRLAAIAFIASLLLALPIHADRGDGNAPAIPRIQGFTNLSPEEQDKFKAAYQKANHDSNVQAAQEKVQAAQVELRGALDKALLEADPSLGAILEKLKAGNGQGRASSGGQPGR
jgi:hypothetical protein